MTPRKKKAQSDQVYRIKITLKESKPPIWRRVDVSGDVTLYDLHHVIQNAMGWYNAHLHQFVIHGECYGMADDDLDMDVEDESKVTLDQFGFGEKSKFRYEYDFGDDWSHEILVEKILPRKPGEPYPVCLKGKGACPPKMSAVSGDMRNSSKSSGTRSTPSMRKCSNGWARNSIRNILTSMKSISG